ncbi:unnamed protein product [Rhizophagus irregularis]|nr:unnamed protein product [Rhizophagus irregularis]CAB5342520.1 unnamed protein product [Rhizophagus irregularis]
MSKERADNEEYKFGILYECYNCRRNNQKMYWIERKYLCYGCRELKWKTVKVYMIKRLEKALEDFKEDFEEINKEVVEKRKEIQEQDKIEEINEKETVDNGKGEEIEIERNEEN